MTMTTLYQRLLLLSLVSALLATSLAGSAVAQQANTSADATAQSPADAKTQPRADATDSSPAVEPVADADEKPKQDKPTTKTLLVNEKQLRFTVPNAWRQVEPRNRLVEVEFAIYPHDYEEATQEPTSSEPAASAAGGNDAAAQPVGRLTMMAAGGDVDANMRRWVGQFRLGRDAGGKDAMHRDKRPLRGAVAHVLDIAGTFFDSPRGPLGPKVELPNYRMLGAIIEIESAGKYFVKFYGPAEIVDENAEAFAAMLEQLEVAPQSDPAAIESSNRTDAGETDAADNDAEGGDTHGSDPASGEVNTPAKPQPQIDQSAATQVEAQG